MLGIDGHGVKHYVWFTSISAHCSENLWNSFSRDQHLAHSWGIMETLHICFIIIGNQHRIITVPKSNVDQGRTISSQMPWALCYRIGFQRFVKLYHMMKFYLSVTDFHGNGKLERSTLTGRLLNCRHPKYDKSFQRGLQSLAAWLALVEGFSHLNPQSLEKSVGRLDIFFVFNRWQTPSW